MLRFERSADLHVHLQQMLVDQIENLSLYRGSYLTIQNYSGEPIELDFDYEALGSEHSLICVGLYVNGYRWFATPHHIELYNFHEEDEPLKNTLLECMELLWDYEPCFCENSYIWEGMKGLPEWNAYIHRLVEEELGLKCQMLYPGNWKAYVDNPRYYIQLGQECPPTITCPPITFDDTESIRNFLSELRILTDKFEYLQRSHNIVKEMKPLVRDVLCRYP